MRQIFWVLLIGPPGMAALTWLITRSWTAMMMRGRSKPWLIVWKKYDFRVILAIFYIVAFTDAIVEHKL